MRASYGRRPDGFLDVVNRCLVARHRQRQVEDNVRLLTVRTGIDLTERMERFSRWRLAGLAGERLSGCVFKKDSPSCGLERVKVYDRHGNPVRGGRGRYAAALVEAHPYLPVEEEGRLEDPRLRDNFIERVFA